MKKRGYNISEKGGIGVKFKTPKRYSVIIMNIETVEDAEKAIHQCELIKDQIAEELPKS